MVPLRSLISSVLMFSFLPTVFPGPLRLVGRADVINNRNIAFPETTDDETGLQFRLSHGVGQPEVKPETKLAPATELSLSETEQILRRLPPMKVDPATAQEFALREGSLPPPRTGNIIQTSSFPASTTATNEPVTAGPLEVLRYAPEGSVPYAPELSITFSQPMVALTSQEEAASTVPVKLDPQPPGKWRWLGTKTLVFDPEGRFPMATTYNVTVPAGIRATSGSTLTTGKTWTFTTPPPTVKASYPSKNGTQPMDALMFIEFDQRIDPAAILPAISVMSGGRILKTRLATGDEVKQAIARDPNGTTPLRQAANDRWLAFRAVDPLTGKADLALPPDSQIRVSILPGAPSAEGRNRTQKPFEFSFSTYGPLKVTKHGCEGRGRCKTYDTFDIEFSNSLIEDIDSSKIKVEP
ncbi:MAG TPA: Ig-like domain-containing protein, partial [Pyrinomonadaceae bacterium]